MEEKMKARVVSLVDMDCFYCQVETRINPSLQGKPVAVVQYNAWKGGGIIAVNYEARARGVTRHMRGDEAKQHCPEIELVQVPTLRDKADLTKYRDAGREVVSVLCTFSDCVQRASIDEAYLDLTAAVEKRLGEDQKISMDQLKNTFIIGYSPDSSNDEEERRQGLSCWLEEVHSNELCDQEACLRLATAGVIVEEMRKAVYEITGFRCSAGIAHNKILAKLACGLHKPNRQSILPHSSVRILYRTLPVRHVRNLGGKFGREITENLGCKMMSDLEKFSEKELQSRYDEKTGTWLYNIARGIDLDPVTPRLISKSIGCCKKFPGRTALASKLDVEHWLSKLAEELAERMLEDQAMNKRRAQLLTISIHCEFNHKEVASSKSTSLTSYDPDKIAAISLPIIKKMSHGDTNVNIWSTRITYLGLSAGKFTDAKRAGSINNFFKSKTSSSCDSSSSSSSSNGCSGKESEGKNEIVKLNTKEDITEVKQPAIVGKSFFQNFLQKNIQDNQADQGQTLESEYFKIGLSNSTKNSELDHKELNGSQIENLGELPQDQAGCTPNHKNSLEIGEPHHVQSEISPKKSLAINNKCTITKFFEKSGIKNKERNSPKKDEHNKEKRTIITLLKSQPRRWIDPTEIFPDVNVVDEEVISFLPPAFREKVLEIKRHNQTKCMSESEQQNHSTFNTGTNQRKMKGNEAPSDEDMFEIKSASPNNKPKVDTSKSESCHSVLESPQKQCPQCFIYCRAFEFDEHMDLHLAEKLDQELNKGQQVKLKNNGEKNYQLLSSPKKTKGKRLNKSCGSSANGKKMKKIDSFFRK